MALTDVGQADSLFNAAYRAEGNTLDDIQTGITTSRRKNADAFRKWTEEMAKSGESISMEDAISYRNEIARLDPTLRNGALSDRVVESLVGRSNQKAAQSILADATKMTGDYATGYENISKMVQTDGDYDSFLAQYGQGLVGPEVSSKDKNAGKREAITAAAQFGFDENAFYEAQHRKRQEAINTAAATKLFTDSADVDDINYHFSNRPAWLREGLGRLMEDKVAKDRLAKINKVQTVYANWNNDTWATYDEASFMRLIKSQLEFEGIEPTDAELNRFATLFQSRQTVASDVKQAAALKAARAALGTHEIFKRDDAPPEEMIFEAMNSLIKQNGGTPYATIDEWRTQEHGASWVAIRNQQVGRYEKNAETIRTTVTAAVDAAFGADGDSTKGKTFQNFTFALGARGVPSKGDGARPELVAIAKAMAENYFVNEAVAVEIIDNAMQNFDPSTGNISDFVMQMAGKYKLKTKEEYKAAATKKMQDDLGARVTPDTSLRTYYAETMGDIQSLQNSLQEKLKALPASAKKDGRWVDPNAIAIIEAVRKRINKIVENFKQDISTDTYYLFTDIRTKEADNILSEGRMAMDKELLNLNTILNTVTPEGPDAPTGVVDPSTGNIIPGTGDSAVVSDGTPNVLDTPNNGKPIGELQIEWEDEGTSLRLTAPAITKTVSNGRGGVMNKTEYLPITWELLPNDVKQKLVDQAYENIKARATGTGRQIPLNVNIESGSLSLDWVHGDEELNIMKAARAAARERWLRDVAAMENQQRIETQTP